MTQQELAATQLAEGLSALKLFRSLGRLYEYVLVTDARGRVLWVSDAFDSLFEGESVVGRDSLQLISGMPQPEQGHAARNELQERGFISNARIDLQCSQGNRRPADITVFAIRCDEACGPLYVSISRFSPGKVDKRCAGETEVANAILDAARDGVLVVDENGFIQYANPAIERLVGTRADVLVGSPIAALVASAVDLDHLVSSLAPDEELCDLDLTLRQGSDSVNVSASVSLLHSEDTHGGTILFLRSSSRRSRVDAELERKNAELEHCVQTLAHDLRSPLVALLGFSRLLRQDFGETLDDTGTHFLDRIEQAGRTMESLIHDILELSRIGQPGERRALVDPRTILLQIQAEVKPRLDEAQISLSIPDHPPLVYCDRTRLYQVFSNLIGNAIDHMGPYSDPFIAVEISNTEEGQLIVVRDGGRGIPAEHHEQIFEVFQSLGPGSDGRRGTGIGLAIVKKIAETHAGRVWVTSEVGAGAAFHVLFPRL